MSENMPTIPEETTSPEWPDWLKQVGALILIILVPALIWFFRPVVFTFLYVFIIAFILRYPIRFFNKKLKVSYTASAIIVFFLFLLLSSVVMLYGLGAVISVAIDLLRDFQAFVNNLLPQPESLNVGPFDLSGLIGRLESWALGFVVSSVFGGPAGIMDMISNIVGTLSAFAADFALIITILLFFLMELPSTVAGIAKRFPEKSRREYAILIQRSDDLFRNYLLGTIVIVLFYWALATVLFAVTGVSDAFIKGFIVAIPNFIPQIGGLISAILVFFIALISGSSVFSMPILIFAFLEMAAFMLISGVAYYFVDARVYARSVKVPVWVILLSLIAFSAVLGIVGFLIAAAAIAIFGEVYFFLLKKVRGEDPYPGIPEPELFTQYLVTEAEEQEKESAAKAEKLGKKKGKKSE